MTRQQDYDIIANADRYYILHELIRNGGFGTISDFAQHLAVFSDVSEDIDRATKYSRIRLVHNHLPRLEDYGLIEYDVRSGDVILTDAERVRSLLETVEELESVTARPV